MILGLNGQKGKPNPKHRNIIKKAIENLDSKDKQVEQSSAPKNNNVNQNKNEKKQKTTQTKKKSQKKTQLSKSKKISKQ